jgi:hypothetical protein
MKLSEVKQKGVYTNKLNNYYDKLVIYKLQFSNNKIYIGQTKNLKKRLYNYINKSETKGHLVKKAILKYGLSNVNIEILKICDDKEDLNNSEIYYISFYNSCDLSKGYNLALGGNSNKPSNQTLIKKIESSKKIKVGQYDLNGNLITIFNSVKEASRELNISDSDIHRCCKTKGTRNNFMFSKCLKSIITPLNINKKRGKWNLKKYKIINIITTEIIIMEGLKNVSVYLNCSKAYLDNIIKRKTIYNKQFKIEKYES